MNVEGVTVTSATAAGVTVAMRDGVRAGVSAGNVMNAVGATEGERNSPRCPCLFETYPTRTLRMISKLRSINSAA